ncbi:hypothetical protein HY469_04715 [Candidatus Roizmanbacteria bacterium]|nr:hypothetical protein [Candidatus Roizmanbacteria bacterium]
MSQEIERTIDSGIDIEQLPQQDGSFVNGNGNGTISKKLYAPEGFTLLSVEGNIYHLRYDRVPGESPVKNYNGHVWVGFALEALAMIRYGLP